MQVTQNDLDFILGVINSITTKREYELPSEYNERIRYLPKELTAKSGFIDYDYVPYFREIVDNFYPLSHIREVALMKSAQIGATTSILESIIAYFIGSCPRPQLYVSADKELVKKAISEKLERMIDNSGLRHLIKNQTDVKTKKTGDTATEKSYPGGFMHGIGAQSGGKLRAMSYPVLLLDEIAGFPDSIAKEGDPVSLARNRCLIPYEDIAKILYLSTPGIEQTCKMINLYKQGDQRNYMVPCLRCGEFIVLHWNLNESQTETGDKGGIIFETLESGRLDKASVFYKCQKCGGLLENHEKAIMLPEGFWKATAVAVRDRFRSYWLNALYSPVGMFSFIGVVESFLDCWDNEKKRVRDIEKYRDFRNTKQGLGFEIRSERMKYERVIEYRRTYSRNMILNKQIEEETGSPMLFLTAACDVHKENIMAHIIGWSKGGVNWTLDFRIIEGDTIDFNSQCWRELEQIVENEIWTADDGKRYKLRLTLVDAGYHTDQVYEFCSQYSHSVYPVFGKEILINNLAFLETSQKTIEKAGCLCYFINTNLTKDRVSQSFRKDWNTGELQPNWRPNFCEDIRDDIFKMYEAEYKVEKRNKETNQFMGFVWYHQIGADNHIVDTHGNNMAAVQMIAEYACIEELKLDSLSWPDFWEWAQKEEPYYTKSNA